MRKIEGKVIESITGLVQDSEVVRITFSDSSYIEQYHHQDCCESVSVEQVDGDIERHIGGTIYSLDEKIVNDGVAGYESCTATFYTLKTSKGFLDWRWFGESNGYYSESVDWGYYDKYGKVVENSKY